MKNDIAINILRRNLGRALSWAAIKAKDATGAAALEDECRKAEEAYLQEADSIRTAITDLGGVPEPLELNIV